MVLRKRRLQPPKHSKPIFVQPLMHPSFTTNLRTFLKQAIHKHKDHTGVSKTPNDERHHPQLERRTPPMASRTNRGMYLPAVQGEIPRQSTRWTHCHRAMQSGTRCTMLAVLWEIQRAARLENLGDAASQSYTKMAPQQRPSRPKRRRHGDEHLHSTATHTTPTTRHKL